MLRVPSRGSKTNAARRRRTFDESRADRVLLPRADVGITAVDDVTQRVREVEQAVVEVEAERLHPLQVGGDRALAR